MINQAGIVVDLEQKADCPDCEKHATAVQTSKHVRRAINLASIDLIEQRHHDENVEDERVVLGRST